MTEITATATAQSTYTFGPSWAYISAHRSNAVDEDTIQAAAVATVFEYPPRAPSETYKTEAGAQRAADAVKAKVESRWGQGSCETRVVRYPGRRADRYVPAVVMIAARAMENVKRGAVDEYIRHSLSPGEELRYFVGVSGAGMCGPKVAWAPICPWV